MKPLTQDQKIIAAFTVFKVASLTIAAQKLNLSPACVSKRLRTLEKELGFELFKRKGSRQVTCTDEGWKFFNSQQE